jgi:4-hydroxy-tetrahydrodipicolinate synthase
VNLEGIFPPVTTPFAADGSVVLERLRENIAKYNRTRLAGYVVNGSTGESVLLTWEEVYRAWSAAREAAAPEKVLIAGTGAESTAETVEHTNRAASLGYHAALVRTPSYFKAQMSERVMTEHFLRVADAAKIPVLIYSVPQFTGVAVEAPVVAKLAEHPNIIGIKESSGNVQRVAEIIAAAPPRFQTLVGSASTLFPSVAMGAVGGILALACALPELCVELYEAVRSGQVERARVFQEQLLVPANILVARYGVAGLKYALDRLGYYGGPPRRPLLSLDEAAKRELDAVLSGVASASATSR